MGKEKIVRIELGKGDDRFTEYREGKAVIKPYVEMAASLQPVADKLAFVEDLCDKYFIKNLSSLENTILAGLKCGIWQYICKSMFKREYGSANPIIKAKLTEEEYIESQMEEEFNDALEKMIMGGIK